MNVEGARQGALDHISCAKNSGTLGEDREHELDREVVCAVVVWRQARRRKPEESPYQLPVSLREAA